MTFRTKAGGGAWYRRRGDRRRAGLAAGQAAV